GLVLVEQDPAAAEQAWEGILQSLEDAGFAVESADLGCVYFETRGVERLYGGVGPAAERALAAVGAARDPCAGAAGRRFAGRAARDGRVLAAHGHAARPDRGARPAQGRPRAEARGAAGAGAGAAARARRADRARGAAARAPARCRRRARHPPARRPAPGARVD